MPAAAFRCTCMGYFMSNLIPYMLGPSGFSSLVLRIGLVINSLASCLVSRYWCVGFGEWFILMLLEHLFQIFASMVLVGTHVERHFAFTSVISFMLRPEHTSVTMVDAKPWAMATVTTVVLLVLGIWWSGHESIDFLKRKMEAMRSIMSMSVEEFESKQHIFPSDPDNVPTTSKEDLDNWKAIGRLEESQCIGQGSFGKVYYCKWNGGEAAARVMTWHGSKLKRVDPHQEAELCKRLIHPNLVQTYTFSSREHGGLSQLVIVQEWCDLGTFSKYCSTKPYEQKGVTHVKKMLSDTCKGTAYLHSCDVIHGDLTSNNVLLKSKAKEKDSDMGFVCKVCDFGLARVLEEGMTELLTSQLGTVSHMPPELFQLEDKRLSKKADIYAIGMLIYEVVTGEVPYKGMMAPMIILKVARGQRVSLPDNVDPTIRDVFQRCTDPKPSERPSADTVVDLLRWK